MENVKYTNRIKEPPVMETVYRLFMFILPYGLSVAAYIWILKKVLRVPHKVYRAIALVMLLAGFGYTLYKLVLSIPAALTNDNFEFVILIVTVVVLALVSIVMALGEPEEK